MNNNKFSLGFLGCVLLSTIAFAQEEPKPGTTDAAEVAKKLANR